ncbi:MAG: hypothetical protein ACPGSO_03900 [Vicingaceae bacterium]
MMRKEIKLNTIVWVLLVVLICLSTLFAENGFQSAYLLIAGLSVVKFLSVIFQFVEVKHAHIIWKLVSILFVLVYFVGILVLY